jgi:DNA-binding transcriptional regulator LsrR (DeoR family)
VAGNCLSSEHSPKHQPIRNNKVDMQRARRQDRKLDLAARAAWLYYVAGNTQDQIAEKLSVSRQAAQRLVSSAVASKLIKFRIDHPLAEGMALAEALRERFELFYCDVVPTDPAAGDPSPAIAIAAAELLERLLSQEAPTVIAFSSGRTLRAMVGELPQLAAPQHKLASLIGAITRDGRAGGFEVVMRLAERTGAQCFPMPTPVVASSREERELLQMQHSFQVILELARQATAAFLGIGEIGWGAPIHRDGFVTDQEITYLIDHGAVGEIAGWAFDSHGRLIAGGTNELVAGIPLQHVRAERAIAVGGGAQKVAALRAALRSRLVAGLVTDEETARAVLAGG